MTIRAAHIILVTIGLIPVTGIAPSVAAASKSEEKPPVAKDHVMTQAQLRYCFFQKVRMEGASEALNNTRKHEVDAFNALVSDWNSRCSSIRFAQPDMPVVEADVKAARNSLRSEGRALVDGWREQRQASLRHVNAPTATLRSGPGTGYGVIAKLRKYQDVYTTGSPVNGWLPVTARNNTGYVEETLVRPGSGKQARREYCEPIAGKPPANAEIIQGKTNGKNILEIQNGLDHDAYVKLKGNLGRTSLAIFVKAKAKIRIKDVQDGSYQIMFATGVDFSRGCGNFTDITDVKAFDDHSVLKSRTDGASTSWTEYGVTLHHVPGGQATAHEIDLADFEAD